MNNGTVFPVTNTRRFRIIFFALVILLYVFTGIFRYMDLRPQSIHQWAQCDRLSVALNYYQNGMDFLKPSVHNIDNGTGITGLEFPLINYGAAILFSIFGYHEILYRILNLVIFSFGMYAAFRITEHFLKNPVLSLMTALLFAASPLLLFYAPNFLPDIAGLSFALISWNCLLKFTVNRSRSNAAGWIVFMMLSSLVKISSLVNLPAMIIYAWFYDRKSFNYLFFIVSGFVIVAVTAAWYLYAAWLSETYQSAVFLLRSNRPQSLAEMKDVWDEVRKVWFDRVYPDMLLILAFAGSIAGCFLKKRNTPLNAAGFVLLACTLVFYLLMWLQLRHHDYYMIAAYPLFLFLFISAIHFLKSLSPRIAGSILVIVIAYGLFVNIKDSKKHLESCYNKLSWKYSSLHFDYFFYLTEEMREMGIRPDDPVITVFDHTPNISLYLMNQPGVTIGYSRMEEHLNTYIKSGKFRYLVYNKASETEYPFVESLYPLEPFYSSGFIKIYKVKTFDPSRSTADIRFNLHPWF